MIENNYPDLGKCLKAKFQNKLRADIDLARALYSIFENTIYRHKKTGYEWSVTFRTGGRIIAEIRDVGEEYYDFYCSRPRDESRKRIYKEAYKMIKKCGWEIPRLTLTERWEFKRQLTKSIKKMEQDIIDHPDIKDLVEFATMYIKDFKKWKKGLLW